MANDFSDCIDRDALAPADPAVLPPTVVSEHLAHESISESLGQAELANHLVGGPVSREARAIATNKFLDRRSTRRGLRALGSRLAAMIARRHAHGRRLAVVGPDPSLRAVTRAAAGAGRAGAARGARATGRAGAARRASRVLPADRQRPGEFRHRRPLNERHCRPRPPSRGWLGRSRGGATAGGWASGLG